MAFLDFDFIGSIIVFRYIGDRKDCSVLLRNEIHKGGEGKLRIRWRIEEENAEFLIEGPSEATQGWGIKGKLQEETVTRLGDCQYGALGSLEEPGPCLPSPTRRLGLPGIAEDEGIPRIPEGDAEGTEVILAPEDPDGIGREERQAAEGGGP